MKACSRRIVSALRKEYQTGLCVLFSPADFISRNRTYPVLDNCWKLNSEVLKTFWKENILMSQETDVQFCQLSLFTFLHFGQLTSNVSASMSCLSSL